MRDGKAVELLVEEKARLLPVFNVHAVVDTVFADLGDRALRRLLIREGEPALALRQPLFFAQGHIVALEKAVDLFAVLLQNLDNKGEEHVLDLFHAERASPKIRRQQPV